MKRMFSSVSESDRDSLDPDNDMFLSTRSPSFSSPSPLPSSHTTPERQAYERDVMLYRTQCQKQKQDTAAFLQNNETWVNENLLTSSTTPYSHYINNENLGHRNHAPSNTVHGGASTTISKPSTMMMTTSVMQDENDPSDEYSEMQDLLHDSCSIRTPMGHVDMSSMFDMPDDDENDNDENIDDENDHMMLHDVTNNDNECRGESKTLSFEGYEYGDCTMEIDNERFLWTHWKYFISTSLMQQNGVVVLLNNFAETIDCFAPIAKHLVSKGFHVISIQFEYQDLFQVDSIRYVSQILCKSLRHIIHESQISHLLRHQRLFICGNGLGASVAVQFISNPITFNECGINVSGLILLNQWILDEPESMSRNSGVIALLSGNFSQYSSIEYVIQQASNLYERQIKNKMSENVVQNIIQYAGLSSKVRVALPIFVACCNGDTITLKSSALRFYQSSPCSVKQIKFYSRSKHALLRDQSLREVITDITNWIQAALFEI